MTVARHFLGWDAPVLPAVAAHLLAHYAHVGVADMRGATLVLPGKRARRRMVELLVEEAASRGVTLIPPVVATVGSVADLLCPPALPMADKVLARRGWSKALRSVGRAGLAPVFPHLPESPTLRDWDKLSDTVAALHKTLTGEGHLFADVARVCRSGASYDDSARWDALAQVQRRYLRILADAGVSDPFAARMAALDAGVKRHEGALWLVALADLPAVTRRLMEASGAQLHALIHAPASMDGTEAEGAPDMAPPFDAWGLPTTGYWEGATVPVTDAVLEMVERPVNQADAVLAALERLDGGTTTQDVILGVHPQSEVVPYLEQRLTARGVGTRYAAGTPLPRTGPVRLLQAVADYLESRSYPALAVLLRHPEAAELLRQGGVDMSGPEAMDTADAYFAAHLPFGIKRDIPRSRGDAAAFPDLVRALERDHAPRPLSRWMPVVMDLLVEAYGERELDRSRPGDRRLLDVLQQVRGAALTLEQAPPALDEQCGFPEAIRAVVDGVAGDALPPDPDRAAVELLEWLEVPLDDAPVALVTGFNEGFLPDSVSGDPFLPDTLCTRLQLPDNRRRMARDAYRLTTVIRSKKTVRLVAGRRTAKGDPLRPSRLMFRIPTEEMAPRVLRFLDDGESSPPPLDLAALGLEPGEESAFTVPPDPVIELDPSEIPHKLRVTDFRSILDDPYRFVLERVWKLESVDDRAREMDPLLFGDLAHTALQRFGDLAVSDPPGVDAGDADAVARVLVRAVRDEVTRRFGRSPLPAVRLQAAQLEARFRAFAHQQAAWAGMGWRMVAVECEPQGEGWPLDVDGTLCLLRGRMDRIDHNASSGEWAVLDYKTGSSVDPPEKSHENGRSAQERWKDLQLPLYWHILDGVVDEAGQTLVPEGALHTGAVKVGYVALPQNPDDGGFFLAGWSPDDLEAAADTARDAVRTLRQGRFEFDGASTRPGREGTDPLRSLLLVGWQAAPKDGDGGDAGAGAEAEDGAEEGGNEE